MKRSENPHDPRHQGVPSGASKMIFEPMVCSAQIMHRSCVKISTISKRTKTSLQLSFNTLEYHRVRPKRYLNLWYICGKKCTYIALTLTPSPNGPNEIPYDPRHLGVQLAASKTISKPMVRSAQTVHRSCVKISTISKRTETSFELSFVTKEYHRVRPKRYLSLWYVWQTMHLSCTKTNTISKQTERDST